MGRNGAKMRFFEPNICIFKKREIRRLSFCYFIAILESKGER